MKSLFRNPIAISSFILIFLLITKFIKPTFNQPIKTLIDIRNITQLQGKLLKSPIKISSKKFYKSKIQLLEVKNNNETYSSIGILDVYIPSEFVEAYYPEKLFSNSKKTNNYLWEEGCYYNVYGKFKNDIFYVEKCSNAFWDDSILGFFYKTRAVLRINFKRLMNKWGSAGGLFIALLTSSKEYVENDIANNFRKAGLSHILALSGMHLSLLSSLAIFIGNKTKRIRFSYLLRLIAIIIFVFFAGFSPSLLRAFISFLILYIYSIFNVCKIDMLEIICFTFIIQINIDPQSITDAAFILSYSSLFGILILSEKINSIYIKILPLSLSKSLSSSTAAQFFTIPFSINMFGSITPVGIISTYFVSPLITLFLYSGLLLFLLSIMFPFFSQISGIFMNFLYNIISFIVNMFAMFPSIKFY